MRLNLGSIIHKPGGSLPFLFSMDLSELEFYGECPVPEPVEVSGTVKNRADLLTLEGEVKGTLHLSCDRCSKEFTVTKTVPLHVLLATELAGDEEDEIVLLDGDELDVQELAFTAFVLEMDTKNLCSENCKGLCPGCGVNLNEEACRCKPAVDPRWATLQQLIDQPE